jgi:hypothetical protein
MDNSVRLLTTLPTLKTTKLNQNTLAPCSSKDSFSNALISTCTFFISDYTNSTLVCSEQTWLQPSWLTKSVVLSLKAFCLTSAKTKTRSLQASRKNSSVKKTTLIKTSRYKLLMTSSTKSSKNLKRMKSNGLMTTLK